MIHMCFYIFLAFSLFWVVVHEIGHSLGLKHSNVTTAYMWPTVSRGYYPEPGLDQDDISGVQAIYGMYTQLKYFVCFVCFYA